MDGLVREAVSGLEAGDEHSVLMDARQVLKGGSCPDETSLSQMPNLGEVLRGSWRGRATRAVGEEEDPWCAHLKQTQRPETDLAATHRWLVQGRLRAETEAVVVAAQCGILETNAYIWDHNV